MKLFPVLLNLEHHSILVIGGGAVALRKVKTLQNFGATITVVAAKFIKEFDNINVIKLKRNIKTISELKPLLQKRLLVVIATENSTLNDMIEQACKNSNILYNRVDMRESTVIFPAILKENSLIIAVSTSGEVPAFSAYLRDMIRTLIKSRVPAVKILREIRDSLKTDDYTVRKSLFQQILTNVEFWNNIEHGDFATAHSIAKKVVEKLEK